MNGAFKGAALVYIAAKGVTPKVFGTSLSVLLGATVAKGAGVMSTMGWILIVTFVLTVIFTILGFFFTTLIKELKAQQKQTDDRSHTNEKKIDVQETIINHNWKNLTTSLNEIKEELKEHRLAMSDNKDLKRQFINDLKKQSEFTERVSRELFLLRDEIKG